MASVSDPLVEGLLEKGARAIAGEVVFEGTTNFAPMRLPRDVAERLVEKAFDSVLPGWREGISREWGVNFDGLPEKRDDERQARASARLWAAPDEHEQVHVVSRLRWVGPWLPVEDGAE